MAEDDDEFPDETGEDDGSISESQAGLPEDFGDSIDPNTDNVELLARIDALETRLNSFPLPQPLFPVFPATLGTDGSWTEITAAGAGQRYFTGSDTVSHGNAITLAANQIMLVEVKGYGGVQFWSIRGGNTAGRITSVASTTNATTWIYAATLIDGQTASAYNGMEWNGTNPSMIQGSPGSLGIAVGTDGSVTGTTCFIRPIGATGWVPFTWDATSSHWTFALPNSGN